MSNQTGEIAGEGSALADKSAAVAKVSTEALPVGLAHLFDDPPLVGNEKREDFDKFFSAVAEAVKPADDIAWLLTWDVVCHSWEIRRERAIKAGIIRSAQIEFVARLLGSGRLMISTVDDLSPHSAPLTEVYYEARRWLQNAEALPKITEIMAKNGYGQSEILVEAFIIGAANIDAVERRVASHEARRMTVLRELENRNEKFAAKLEDASTRIIDVGVTDASQEPS